jgi:hypothetical protein
MKIGFITMGTGDYCKYITENLVSFHKYFLPKYERKFLYITDDESYTPPIDSEFIKFPFYKWPLATLYKPKAISLTYNKLKNCDIIYWIDVDLKCIDYITDVNDVFPTKDHPIACVSHCGWLNDEGNEVTHYPYELNPKSTAFVRDIYKVPYHQACLFGGFTNEFYSMIRTLDKNIDKDLQNDIIAIWHDESHLNRYFQDNCPKSIPKTYARPEAMGVLLPNTKIKSIMKPNLNEE